MTTHTLQPQRTLLIVDDDKHTRNLLQKSFESAGFLVVTAVNGRQGLEQALDRMPDLVLSDVVMPEMNGYDLCRELKAHPKTQAIPVILLTARGDTDSTLEGFLAGADEYIAKPFEMQEVLARVQRVCRWVDSKQQSATTLSGNLSHTPMFELLRFCEEHRISGFIQITRAEETDAPVSGRVHLRLGEIAAIELGSHTDMTAALDELLEWTEGSFVVKPQELQLPGVAEANRDAAPAPVDPPTPASAAEPDVSAAAEPESRLARLGQPLHRILEELQADSDGLEHVVVADEAGRVISAVTSPPSASSEHFGPLLAAFLRLSRAVDQELALGPLQEGLILSADGVVLVAPAAELGVLGAASAKENQGMMRWNCKEAIDKIIDLTNRMEGAQ
jgi:CheY-like chemotaxis protein/predicted regulator of Ras-like GTPase activity (Roadblock/LC7/MglB family)